MLYPALLDILRDHLYFHFPNIFLISDPLHKLLPYCEPLKLFVNRFSERFYINDLINFSIFSLPL